jgi:hypothetical protein
MELWLWACYLVFWSVEHGEGAQMDYANFRRKLGLLAEKQAQAQYKMLDLINIGLSMRR